MRKAPAPAPDVGTTALGLHACERSVGPSDSFYRPGPAQARVLEVRGAVLCQRLLNSPSWALWLGALTVSTQVLRAAGPLDSLAGARTARRAPPLVRQGPRHCGGEPPVRVQHAVGMQQVLAG